jgi:hypothetical protein
MKYSIESTQTLLRNHVMLKRLITTALALCLFLNIPSFAQSTSAPTRVRGSIEKMDVDSIIFKERRGEILKIALAPNLNITEVFPIKMSEIQENTFIGTATLTNAAGKLEALEVLVFPEAMRGTGEGHYAWDLMPGSMMTNATVSQLKSIGNTRELTLAYKGGSQVVFVPENTPIVTFRPGAPSLLVTQANAILTVIQKDGQPVVTRIVVGKDGFKPPM